VAGCSISHGTGVDKETRYGQLISNQLNIDCSFLTRPGSAIDWASDQIVRSDIRKGDIVIWGLTQACRTTFVHDNQLLPGVTVQSYQIYPNLDKILPLSTLLSQNTLYHHYMSIERAINFCKKCQAKLLMIGLSHQNSGIVSFLKTKKNYFLYPYRPGFDDVVHTYIDFGTDNCHPGPMQHQEYADFCQSTLKKLNYI
jgi:hypothetical protein